MQACSRCGDYSTGWTSRGSDLGRGKSFFLIPKTSIPVLGPTQPTIEWISEAFTLALKWRGREADHSPPSAGKVKNELSCTSIPVYPFMACVGKICSFCCHHSGYIRNERITVYHLFICYYFSLNVTWNV